MAESTVIVLATLKGGSGKTTLAACLAVYWQAHGRNPVLVDADPQLSLAAWHRSGNRLGSLEVHTATGERVNALISRLKATHPLVVVDTAGFRNRATAEALAAADLAIIPVKPSAMDVRVALETNRLLIEINSERARQRRPVVTRFVLTMTTPGSVIARHIRNQMIQAGLPLFSTEIANRVGFGEAMLEGATPTLTEPVSLAAREVAALAQEIESILPGPGPHEGGGRPPDFQVERSLHETQETQRSTRTGGA